LCEIERIFITEAAMKDILTLLMLIILFVVLLALASRQQQFAADIKEIRSTCI